MISDDIDTLDPQELRERLRKADAQLAFQKSIIAYGIPAISRRRPQTRMPSLRGHFSWRQGSADPKILIGQRKKAL
ncbi:hypothetical protein J2738_001951 [Variovorax paradoxus]|uniref:Uncharacterized protein n=1 Tax=Variovorax paradoxus TaxID=34073 RepID=A0AAE4BXC7_VARPD|nr:MULTISPECIES: hypothetical protein [Variovorax]MDR6425822.1 hypothetical protein [Variovorax paradoxus]